jgi:hypothetical protein
MYLYLNNFRGRNQILCHSSVDFCHTISNNLYGLWRDAVHDRTTKKIRLDIIILADIRGSLAYSSYRVSLLVSASGKPKFYLIGT